jgi:hypothetical protein
MLSDMEHKTNKKKFEDTKGVIRIRTSGTADDTMAADDAMANRKRTKRQIMIYKLYNNVQQCSNIEFESKCMGWVLVKVPMAYLRRNVERIPM